MQYESIEDLPSGDELGLLQSSELAALGELWVEKKGELENSGEFQYFIKKMKREWAIETGIIERLYSWDRGVTETLIEQGIDSSVISHAGGMTRQEAENVAKMIEDQQNIVEGLFSFVKGEQPFSEHFIRSMHQQLTAHQDYTEAMTPDGKLIKIELLKGKYKEQPNNPKRPDGQMHEYCPPELVQDEMERLINLYKEYEGNIRPEVLSSWLHHRFTQIHPFQDGNGRIARAIASLVFLKSGLFPLVIRDSDRTVYISALESADNGDLAPLVKLFAKRQRDSILSALGIQQQVEQAKHSEQIISNAIDLLSRKSKEEKDKVDEIYVVARNLQEKIEEKLSSLKGKLDPQLRQVDTNGNSTFNASTKFSRDGDEDSYYFRRQIIDVAKTHDYYANLNHYKSWSRIIIFTDKIFELVFSVHGYGQKDNGVMVVSGFTFEKIPSEDGSEATSPKACHPDIFQFNYLEKSENINNRFDEWLEESVTFALAEWQRTIA